LRLQVENFKNIGKLSMELKPLTIILGPPVSGKSNLLEAIELLGFLGKLLRLDMLYRDINSFCNSEPSLREALRIDNPLEVFPWMDPQNQPKLALEAEGSAHIEASLVVEKGKLHVKYTLTRFDVSLSAETIAPIAVVGYAELSHYCKEILEESRRKLLKSLGDAGKQNSDYNLLLEQGVIEARLYGYERYAIEARLEDVLRCVHDSCMQPDILLSETGGNLAYIASISPLPLRRLQEWINEVTGGLIELKARTRDFREVIFFSREVEIPPRLVSDTIIRVLYYTLALYTAARYAKLYSLQGRVLVLLEEPEARTFPYSFELLAKSIREALDAGVYVALTTHNGVLASKLLDVVGKDELGVYYAYSGRDGYMRLREVSVDTLAEKLMLPDDLLLMKPEEVLRELGGVGEASGW